MTRMTKMRRAAIAFAALGTLLAMSPSALARGGDLRRGALYTQTDATLGNQVIAFYRDSNGTLAEAGRYSTGGRGLGGHLISAGSVTLSGNTGHQFLFVTNSLSNDLSVFSVGADALTLVERLPTGGLRPVSVTVHDDLVYVVHEVSGTIAGFRADNGGHLTPILGSTRLITANLISEPFQVQFNNAGSVLAVADENTNLINTFVVDPATGLTGPAIVNNAYGLNPFGMIFDQYDHLFSTAGGFDIPLLSSMSSFIVQPDGSLQVVSPNVGNRRQFECWIAITSDAGVNGGHFGYTDNTGDSTISSYFIRPDGSMELLKSVAATAASYPLIGIEDNAMTADSKYYYAVSLTGHMNAWAIQPNGDLAPLQQINRLPLNIAGLAVR